MLAYRSGKSSEYSNNWVIKMRKRTLKNQKTVESRVKERWQMEVSSWSAPRKIKQMWTEYELESYLLKFFLERKGLTLVSSLDLEFRFIDALDGRILIT